MDRNNKFEGERFQELIGGLYEMRGKPAPSRTVKALWYRALVDFDLDDIQAAMDRYLSDQSQGMEMPQPRHILRFLAPQQMRLSADEAWAIALTAQDENDTVIWTDEIAEASAVATPILDEGDKIGARMAFRSAYERIVAEKGSCPPVVMVSLGYDRQRRDEAIKLAVEQGRIGHEEARRIAPSLSITREGRAIAGLLTGDSDNVEKPLDDGVKKWLKKLREDLQQTDIERRLEKQRKVEREQRELTRKRDEAAWYAAGGSVKSWAEKMQGVES